MELQNVEELAEIEIPIRIFQKLASLVDSSSSTASSVVEFDSSTNAATLAQLTTRIPKSNHHRNHHAGAA